MNQKEVSMKFIFQLLSQLLFSGLVRRRHTAPIFFPFCQGGAVSEAEVGRLKLVRDRKDERAIERACFLFFITVSKDP